MYEVLGYQRIKAKNGNVGYFVWLAENAAPAGVGKKSFQTFFWEDKLPVPPEPGTIVEVRWSRSVNPRTQQPYVDSVTW